MGVLCTVGLVFIIVHVHSALCLAHYVRKLLEVLRKHVFKFGQNRNYIGPLAQLQKLRSNFLLQHLWFFLFWFQFNARHFQVACLVCQNAYHVHQVAMVCPWLSFSEYFPIFLCCSATHVHLETLLCRSLRPPHLLLLRSRCMYTVCYSIRDDGSLPSGRRITSK